MSFFVVDVILLHVPRRGEGGEGGWHDNCRAMTVWIGDSGEGMRPMAAGREDYLFRNRHRPGVAGGGDVL